jgi:hypothetical protein
MTDDRQREPSEPERGARLWRAFSWAKVERDARTGRWQVIGRDGEVLIECETDGAAVQWISVWR